MGKGKLNRLICSPFFIFRCLRKLFQYCIYTNTFQYFGFGSIIIKPLHLDGSSNIKIGKRVIVHYKTWLAALPLTGEKGCLLQIEDGAVIGHFNHIYATKRVVIEENVLTADKVYISDNLHGYEDVNIPIKSQPIIQNREVIIGKGSWLGENVSVLGAKIGKQCVIGANSVVTKDIPDYCIAVGVPAAIIKRYCFDTNKWRKTDFKGFFID